MKKVRDAADPNRCAAVTNAGQCWNERLEGYLFCGRHAPVAKAKVKERAMRTYKLANPDLQTSFDEFGQAEQIRTLRDEISLTRSLLERRLNLAKNDSEFLAACGAVNQLLATLEKLVSSCHRMEVSLGKLLDKSSIFSLGQEIVKILCDEMSDLEDFEERVDRISTRLVTAIGDQTNKES